MRWGEWIAALVTRDRLHRNLPAENVGAAFQRIPSFVPVFRTHAHQFEFAFTAKLKYGCVPER